MKLSKIILYIMVFAIFLSGCQGIKETLSNKKKTNSNEFLVKKKAPLILPPDYKKLPEPRQDNTAKQESKDKISEILKITKSQSTNKKSSSVEQSIINEIRKWKIKNWFIKIILKKII